MIITIIIGLIMLSSVITFIHSLIRDYHKSNPKGYRYSDIPSGVNMLELWALLIIAMVFQIATPMTIIAIIQVVIGFHSLSISVRHRRPYWFDWA